MSSNVTLIKSFWGGPTNKLLLSKGIRVNAAPPYRQSQNGLVESHWRVATSMARSFLAEASLPKRFWFWAVREAALRMNMVPCLLGSSKTYTTPFELFYGVKPDLRTLFPFGCIGYYRRPRDGLRGARTHFESQSFTGIALGRADTANGMLFWNPTLSRFCVSADYTLDSTRAIADPFPTIVYDGGLHLRLYTNPTTSASEAYPPGSVVFVRLNSAGDVSEGIVNSVPTSLHDFYLIDLLEGASLSAAFGDLISPDEALNPDFSHLPRDDSSGDPLAPLLPPWMVVGTKLILALDGTFVRGSLDLDDDLDWLFVRRNSAGQIIHQTSLVDLPYTWRQRLHEETLFTGWNSVPPSGPPVVLLGNGQHVSASSLLHKCPSSLDRALLPTSPDRLTWLASYQEEYDSLVAQDTFHLIDASQLSLLGCTVIPSMTVLTIKCDELGHPVRAKSRIVVLGNLETTYWSKSDTYAPVLGQLSLRLLVSLAVERRRLLKQGDCKNAFCHPVLPPDEVVVIKPPYGCPISKPGTYWRLHKTLYGLRRSPRHWFTCFRDVLLSLGLSQCPHEPCIFFGSPMPSSPPLYVGIYVDDFAYFSVSDEVEQWFEAAVAARLRVDFMGPISWFLGIYFAWHPNASTGHLSVHLSQEAYLRNLLDRFDMVDCRHAPTPYRSGLVYDRIVPDGAELSPKARVAIITQYQSLIGALNWLAVSTRPDVSVALTLLAQHNSYATPAHLLGAKYVLRYLAGSADHGIAFTSQFASSYLSTTFGWPKDTPTLTTYTDANWGPQDASKPNPTDIISLAECCSLLGSISTRTGGPIAWHVIREPRVSRSTCESEIKSADEGTKVTQFIRHILSDLHMPDVTLPTPLWNDNRGAVDWSHNCANKKMRHINIRNMAVRDAHRFSEIFVTHLPGDTNVADLFTKEHKDDAHFLRLRNIIVPSHGNFLT